VRALLVIALLALAGCGDDTTSPSTGPDMSMLCMGANPTCCPGVHCSPAGSTCSGFESSCTCNSDGTWHCQGVLPRDMATPTD
jgi:hypothetical protein